MAVNKKLLRKVRALIVAEPRRLYMGSWGQRYTAPSSRIPPCKTTACLAGWTILASTPKSKWPSMFRKHDGMLKGHPKTGFRETAEKLLGIPAMSGPFDRVGWGTREVIRWIDRQLAS